MDRAEAKRLRDKAIEAQRAEELAFREQVRETLRRRNQDAHTLPVQLKPTKPVKGGFIHLLPAISAVASALPSIIDVGKSLFKGSGKHKETARTKKPNKHAEAVGRIMAEAKKQGSPISLGEASKRAKAMLNK
jgi:hypothetical protein